MMSLITGDFEAKARGLTHHETACSEDAGAVSSQCQLSLVADWALFVVTVTHDDRLCDVTGEYHLDKPAACQGMTRSLSLNYDMGHMLQSSEHRLSAKKQQLEQYDLPF